MRDVINNQSQRYIIYVASYDYIYTMREVININHNNKESTLGHMNIYTIRNVIIINHNGTDTTFGQMSIYKMKHAIVINHNDIETTLVI